MENKSSTYPNGHDIYTSRIKNDDIDNNDFNSHNINNEHDITNQTLDNNTSDFNTSLNHVTDNDNSNLKHNTDLFDYNKSNDAYDNNQDLNDIYYDNYQKDYTDINTDFSANEYIPSKYYNDEYTNDDFVNNNNDINSSEAFTNKNFTSEDFTNKAFASEDFANEAFTSENFSNDNIGAKDYNTDTYNDTGYNDINYNSDYQDNNYSNLGSFDDYNDNDYNDSNYDDDSYEDTEFDDATSTMKGSKLYKKKKWIFISEFVALILIGLGIYVARIFAGTGEVVNQGGLDDSEVALKTKTGHLTLALLGSDAEDESGVRADTIIIADINQDNGDIKLVSVARDFFAYVPGYKDVINKRVGKQAQGSDFTKINHSYNMGEDIHTGSPTTTIKTLDTNLCLGIKDYITVNFDSMADLIELTDGVDVSFEGKDEHFVFYVNKFGSEAAKASGKDYDDLSYDVAGQSKVHLDGYQALGYCRVRKQTDGHPEHPLKNESDFTRSERQKEVIGLILENIKKKGVSKLPEIADVFKKKQNFQTSLSMTKLLELATDAVKNGYHLSNEEKLSIPVEPHEVVVGKNSTQFPKNCLYEDARALHYYLYGDENTDITHFKDVMQISDQLETYEKQYSPNPILNYCFDQSGNYNEAVTNWTPNGANTNDPNDPNNQSPNNNANNTNTNNTTPTLQSEQNTNSKKKNN